MRIKYLHEPERIEKMRCFIRSHGGSVRFDQYIEEHLYGEDGYYTGAEPFTQFHTDAQDNRFAHLMRSYVRKNGFTNKTFIELAGGDGTFKRNFLALEGSCQDYRSVEISPKLLDCQTNGFKMPGHLTNAARLPFEDNSIEGIIFANELLDATPFRVLEGPSTTTYGGPVFTREWYVTESSLKTGAPAKRPLDLLDRFVEECQWYYDSIGYGQFSNRMQCVSSLNTDILNELSRVLHSGTILLFDYGYGCAHTDQFPNYRTQPYILAGTDWRRLFWHPYRTDATRFIDFFHLESLALRVFPNARVMHLRQDHFFRKIAYSDPEVSERLRTSFLIEGWENEFPVHVLIIKKE